MKANILAAASQTNNDDKASFIQMTNITVDTYNRINQLYTYVVVFLALAATWFVWLVWNACSRAMATNSCDVRFTKAKLQ